MGKKTLLIIICLIAAIIGISGAIVASFVIDRRPEWELAKTFLLSSEIISDRFGEPLTISDSSESAKVSFPTKGGIEGRFRFIVRGSKESGKLDVFWHNETESDDGFQVVLIELLKKSGAKPDILWEGESVLGAAPSQNP